MVIPSLTSHFTITKIDFAIVKETIGKKVTYNIVNKKSFVSTVPKYRYNTYKALGILK